MHRYYQLTQVVFVQFDFLHHWGHDEGKGLPVEEVERVACEHAEEDGRTIIAIASGCHDFLTTANTDTKFNTFSAALCESTTCQRLHTYIFHEETQSTERLVPIRECGSWGPGGGTLSLAWKRRQHGSMRRKKTHHLWCSEMLHQAGAWYQQARWSQTWLRTRRSLTQQSSVLMNRNWITCVEELNVTGNIHLDIWHHGDGFETCWTLSNHYMNPDRMYPQTPTKTSTNSAVLLDIQWKYQHSLLVLLLTEATMVGRERREICYLPAASPRCS